MQQTNGNFYKGLGCICLQVCIKWLVFLEKDENQRTIGFNYLKNLKEMVNFMKQ
jgi:hypothetical protein